MEMRGRGGGLAVGLEGDEQTQGEDRGGGCQEPDHDPRNPGPPGACGCARRGSAPARQDVVDRGHDLVTVGEARAGVLRHETLNKPDHVVRDVLDRRPERRRRLVDHAVNEHRWIVAGEGKFAAQEEVQRRAQAVQVGPSVQRIAAALLGGHEGGCAENRARHGDLVVIPA